MAEKESKDGRIGFSFDKIYCLLRILHLERRTSNTFPRKTGDQTKNIGVIQKEVSLPSLRKVYVSRSALKTIFEECKKSPGRETGGALVGTFNEDRICVMEASGPGLDAVHTVASFSPDVYYLENFVKYYEERGFSFVGQWHKHPSYIERPSGGDIAQIMEIIKDNPHLNFFVNMISIPTGRGFKVSATIFFRDEITESGCFPSINVAELFLEGDVLQLAMQGLLAEKVESDIFVREMETPGEKILPKPEAYVTESQEVIDASVPADIMAKSSLRVGRKGLVGEIYGDEVADSLERKILYEKKLMGLLFPEFKIMVKERPGRLFWFTVFHGHEVALVLEKNGTYTILIEPEVEKINLGEKVFNSALFAALVAKASILSRQLDY
jgi:proteasome lid subunit RPN8/RPN11